MILVHCILYYFNSPAYQIVLTRDDKIIFSTNRKCFKNELWFFCTQYCFQKKKKKTYAKFQVNQTEKAESAEKNADQRKITQKQHKVELSFLCTALRIIATNRHVKFQVNRT